MKIIASMQPYFFPYLGYWQLIHAADCFVLADVAQYSNRSWINRNRILSPVDGWQYITVPLKKHSMKEIIRNVMISPNYKWKELIIGKLAHYKKKAPYFACINELVENLLFDNNGQSISDINCTIIKNLCKHLDIKTDVIIASEYNFDYSSINDAGDWALRESEQLGATNYINPVAGAALYQHEKFVASNIKLSFLQCQEIIYPQSGAFEPSLSIIDVLMFNGIDGTKELLNNFIILEAKNNSAGIHRSNYAHP